MPTIEIESEQLLNAALQMSKSELEDFLAKLFAAKAREYAPVLSQRESELFRKINQGLPAQQRKRYDALIRKRRRSKLTGAERAELLALTQQMEQFDVERLKCMAELAQLRGIPLPDLMKQLGLEPPEPEYV
ncbi:MAG: STAS/SEC14 domain-containing protein [Acidobacteriota bacterium]